jgi:large subunit ribosomal protein L23
MTPTDRILKQLRVTEKSATLQANQNQVTFEVYPTANRRSVAAAVEAMFDVKVTRVNILNQPGKTKRNRSVRGSYGRTSAIKKAVVTLEQGSNIDLA